MTRLPTGHCIYINKKNSNFFKIEPWLVKCHYFEPPDIENPASLLKN